MELHRDCISANMYYQHYLMARMVKDCKTSFLYKKKGCLHVGTRDFGMFYVCKPLQVRVPPLSVFTKVTVNKLSIVEAPVSSRTEARVLSSFPRWEGFREDVTVLPANLTEEFSVVVSPTELLCSLIRFLPGDVYPDLKILSKVTKKLIPPSSLLNLDFATIKVNYYAAYLPLEIEISTDLHLYLNI